MCALTVLVVDDDPDVRDLVVGHLRETGHHAIDAATGHEAIILFEAHPEMDLIFTDIPAGARTRSRRPCCRPWWFRAS